MKIFSPAAAAASVALLFLAALCVLLSSSSPSSSPFLVAAQPVRGKDFYSILGVARGASDKEIKAQYKKLARDLHPDRANNKKKSDKEREDMRKRFIAVTEAYEILSDDEKRKRFDETGMGMHGNEDRQWLRQHLFQDDFDGGKQHRDKEMFSLLRGENPNPAIIFFWSPNFPDCVDAAKPFKTLAQKLKGTSLVVGSYKCDENPMVCRELYLGAVPKIVAFRANGGPQKRQNFQGRYELLSLMAFASEFFSAGSKIPFPTVAPTLWHEKTPNPETAEMRENWHAEFFYDSRRQSKLAENTHDLVAFEASSCTDCDTELRYAAETWAETVPTVRLARADCVSAEGRKACKRLGFLQENRAWTVARMSRRCWFHTKKPFQFSDMVCEEVEVQRYTEKRFDSKLFMNFVLEPLIKSGAAIDVLDKAQLEKAKEGEDAWSIVYVNRKSGIPDGLKLQWSLLTLYAARNPPKSKKGDNTLRFAVVECSVQPAGTCADVQGKSFPVLATYAYTSKAKKRGAQLKTNSEEFLGASFMTLLRDAQKEAEPLRIHMLDNGNFDKKLAAAKARNKRFFIMFNAGEWCPPCMQMKPLWPEMARALQEDKDGKKIAIGLVDCDKQRQLCGRLQIDGFPSMMYYTPERAEPVKYGGPREAEALKDFAIEQLTSRVVAMEPREIMQKVQSGQTLLVAFNAGQWCPPCVAIKPKFKAASNKIGDVPATMVDCDELGQFCQMFQIDGFPTLILFHQGGRHVWDGNPMSVRPEDIASWVMSSKNTVPNARRLR